MIRWSTPLLFGTLLGSSFVGQAQSVTFHADVDLDDAVTIADLLQLLSAFGEPC